MDHTILALLNAGAACEKLVRETDDLEYVTSFILSDASNIFASMIRNEMRLDIDSIEDYIDAADIETIISDLRSDENVKVSANMTTTLLMLAHINFVKTVPQLPSTKDMPDEMFFQLPILSIHFDDLGSLERLPKDKRLHLQLIPPGESRNLLCLAQYHRSVTVIGLLLELEFDVK